jgi:hypothetical protein
VHRVLSLIFGVILLGVTACGGAVDAVPTSAPARVSVAAATLPPPTQARVPTVAPSPTQPPAPPTSANPLDALTRAFRGWGGVKSFRVKMTTASGTAAGLEMTMERVMPDRFHMVSKQFEAIMIGQTFYMKIGAQWQKMVMPNSIDLSFADVKKYETELGASSETKLIGPDVLDGTPTLVYQYTTTIKTPTPTTVTSKVWIAVADGLPRKMESESKAGTKTVMTFYDYNANISIEAPIK